jgi:hypothetical protein
MSSGIGGRLLGGCLQKVSLRWVGDTAAIGGIVGRRKGAVSKVITHGSNGALEQVKDDGSRVISYRKGSSKECASALRASPLKPPHPARRFTIDGRIVVRYNNGDMKETATDGTITH